MDNTWVYASEVTAASMYSVAIMRSSVRYVPDTRYWRRRIEWRRRMANKRALRGGAR